MPTRSPLLYTIGALLVGALLIPSGLLAQSYTWKNVAIRGGGFVSGIIFHPTTPDLIYARTDVGGAYRWNAASQSWVALNDDIGGLNNEFMNEGVVSFALDPANPQRVYLATGQYNQPWAPNANLFSSIDQGATWTRNPLPFKLGGNEDGRSTGERLQVDPNQPRILYLGTTANGVWRSADNGKTWRQITTFPENKVTLVQFDRSSATYGHPSTTIYVGVAPSVSTSPNLYRSTDSGATWQSITGEPTGLIPHHVGLGYAAQNALYIAYSDALGPNGASTGAVWKLNTTTGAWTNITPPTGQGGFGGLSVDASNPNTLVVTTMDRWYPRDELYRSTDGGATWKVAFDYSIWDNTPAPWSTARSIHWAGDVDIDPTNPNRVMFITGYGLWSANDLTKVDSNQFMHWTFLDKELEETVPIALASPNGGIFHLISALGDIGGFRHRYLRGSPPLVDYFAPYRGTSDSIDFAENVPSTFVRTVGDHTYGQYSIDTGGTWSYFGTAAPGAIANGQGNIAISADASRLLWVPVHSAPAYSVDNGANWTPSTGGPSDLSVTYFPVADRSNSNKFYIFDTAHGTAYRSVDGGVTFVPAATGLPTGADVMRAVPGIEGNLWLPEWSNGLYRSTDSAANFVKVPTVQEAYKVGFGKAAAGQTHPAVYIWGKVSGVVGFFRSNDIGVTWTRINDDQHQYGYINQIVGDPRIYGRVFLATSGRGIIYGQPSGTSYPDEEVDPNDPVFSAPIQHPIYTDVKESPWDIWNWGVDATFSIANTSPVHTGNFSIRAPFNQSWGQIYINRSQFPTDGLTDLRFWVNGGTTGGQGVTVTIVRRGSIYLNAYMVPKTMLQANTWNEVVIPLSALGATNLPDVIAIAIGVYDFDAANPPAPFYLDDILLE